MELRHFERNIRKWFCNWDNDTIMTLAEPIEIEYGSRWREKGDIKAIRINNHAIDLLSSTGNVIVHITEEADINGDPLNHFLGILHGDELYRFWKEIRHTNKRVYQTYITIILNGDSPAEVDKTILYTDWNDMGEKINKIMEEYGEKALKWVRNKKKIKSKSRGGKSHSVQMYQFHVGSIFNIGITATVYWQDGHIKATDSSAWRLVRDSGVIKSALPVDKAYLPSLDNMTASDSDLYDGRLEAWSIWNNEEEFFGDEVVLDKRSFSRIHRKGHFGNDTPVLVILTREKFVTEKQNAL